MCERYNVVVNTEALIGTTEYLTLQVRCRINRYPFNGVRPHFPQNISRHRQIPIMSKSIKNIFPSH